MEIMVEEEEEEEEEEKPWMTVNKKKKKMKKKKKKKKKKEEEEESMPPWDALPSLVLSNIIRNLDFKDRLVSIPFVCKAWNSVISSDPRCWSSMVPESVSPDDAFIKKPEYYLQVDEPSKLHHQDCPAVLGKWVGPSIRLGVSHFRTLIKKSSLCSGSSTSTSTSTITSLCLDPFHFSKDEPSVVDQDEILHLIAHCCPNLKHISFHGFYSASIEAVLQVFHRCKKIELIDFSDTRYDSVEMIEELGNCLPHLCGIRLAEWKYYCVHDAIATHLPHIKLLAVECSIIYDEYWLKLTSETKCCLYELQYLSIGLHHGDYTFRDPPVCTHVPEFYYELHNSGDGRCDNCDPPRRPVHRTGRTRKLCFYCDIYIEQDIKAAEAAAEVHWENLQFEEEYSVLDDEKR